jgi:cytochrome c oxidase cbb3-type subunit 2
MNRGKWRDLFEPQSAEIMDVTLPRSEEWIAMARRSGGGVSAAMG